MSEVGSQLDPTAENAAGRGAHGGGPSIGSPIRSARRLAPRFAEAHWQACRSWKLVVKTRFHSITSACGAWKSRDGAKAPARDDSRIERFERVLVSRCRLQKSVQRIFPTGARAARRASSGGNLTRRFLPQTRKAESRWAKGCEANASKLQRERACVCFGRKAGRSSRWKAFWFGTALVLNRRGRRRA